MRLGALVLASVSFIPIYPADRPPPKQPPPPVETQAKNPDAAARIARKEARMKQRDKEMDRRMKQKK